MKTTKKKIDKENIDQLIAEAEELVKQKKMSKTWLAFLKAVKNPGIEIVDMRAVLK
ncbi:hypothetical protein H8B06_08665 [Sphingobacterium sp. DN00404]|uniref:Uncharacterized protein n=1 Tax=Sphingobacterium micropteri TaxID=2763501 RepID=A0ABR7YNH9_9SPHI|nr:hypothetical protein [Sphingobacterium micropteri]MBD1432894.1 hypothetical protein [Sphingobacterium micropteri]